ncbi:MAG: hypothetical protein KJ892_18040, partial [Gammaproteobacteria bacterium]|nr:hypothetical protein [Gammaproteobacteria bacterium]
KTQGAGFRQGILFQSHDFAQEPFFGIIDYTGLFGSPGIAGRSTPCLTTIYPLPTHGNSCPNPNVA